MPPAFTGTYPIYETFHSWQGEGDHSGKSAYFIRLFGCPLRCPWCDTPGSWDSRFAPKQIARFSAAALAQKAADSKAAIAVITGGEPTIHDLNPLTTALHNAGLRTHLETCGAFPIHGDFDWVTLSPKPQALATPENLLRADELKLIISAPEDLATWAEFLRQNPTRPDTSRWLHPEWSRRNEPELPRAITRWVLAHGGAWRAGWQIHKCYNADPPPPEAQQETVRC
jgi:organic radical activating enzyme